MKQVAAGSGTVEPPGGEHTLPLPARSRRRTEDLLPHPQWWTQRVLQPILRAFLIGATVVAAVTVPVLFLLSR